MLRVDTYPTHEYQGYKLRPGKPLPFGATFVPGGVNFSVYSSHASTCVLVLFDKGAPQPKAEIPFPNEFRIGNVPAPKSTDGQPFESPADLLNQTPEFMRVTVDSRLNKLFGAVYRYAEQFFEGENLYMLGLEKNCSYLQKLLEEKRLYRLQRRV